jgi:kynurenine 3-monooxygenase
MRPDIRRQETVFGRSINLALSCRGREALRHVGVEDQVTSSGIPMYARMIHDLDGRRRPIQYGTKDQYIMSVDRRRLNELLLSAAEKYASVSVHFEHKLISCDFDKGELEFDELSSGQVKRYHGDLIVGCDGAYSAVRSSLMRYVRLDYSQEYIPHGYIELRVKPTDDDEFAMEANYLHIWPREEFMLIALPNVKDQSFVSTLFMPFEMFDSLRTDQDVLRFFDDTFPDAVPLIGRDELVETFRQLTATSLVSVKCRPYHYSDRGVLLGDAAHAMVPFYGQGLNCGLEDLLVFDSLMDKYNDDLHKVLEQFSAIRSVDAQTMNDLAMYNYVEMRSHVNSWSFLLRKKLDSFLYWLLPRSWIPLYTTVSFTRTRYSECVKNRAWQDKIVSRTLKLVVGCSLLTAVYTAAQLTLNDTEAGFWSIDGAAVVVRRVVDITKQLSAISLRNEL